MESSKDNPPEISLQAEVSRGSQESESFPKRINRYSNARAHARQFGEWLLGQKEHEKTAKKIGLCGEWLLFRHYYTVDQYRLMGGYFCKQHLLCPLCALRRGAKALRAYSDKLRFVWASEGPLMASMVTPTVKDGEDLLERFGHLQGAMKRLNQRRRDGKRKRASRSEWSKVLGLAGAYEIGIGRGSGIWHPHAHMIVLHCEEIHQAALADEWYDITGDSHQIDIRPLRNPQDPAQDLCEIFKYAMKPASMKPEQVLEAWLLLKRKQLIFSAGLLRGVKVPEELTDDPLDLPYVELLYKYYEDAGYSLARYSQVDNGAPPIILQ
jgi:hypothetical protein